MDRAAYEIEARLQRQHWWFRGRRRILTRFLAALDPPLRPGARVLDIGCGTGANGPVLSEDGRFAVGLDASPVPLDAGDKDGHRARVRGDATELPFKDGAFDLVCALDVLEHLDDDRAALREIQRVLAPGGWLVIFVPALRLLWGFQDEVAHHRRRYGKDELVRLTEAAGFDVQRVTFFNTLLFPPILAARLAMKLHRPANLQSETEIAGPLTNTVLGGIFALEAPLLERLNLPIGVSLACIAKKPSRP